MAGILNNRALRIAAYHAVPGAIGAGIGAGVDKKNRFRGALIGGAAGAGVGQIAGRVLGRRVSKQVMDAQGSAEATALYKYKTIREKLKSNLFDVKADAKNTIFSTRGNSPDFTAKYNADNLKRLDKRIDRRLDGYNDLANKDLMSNSSTARRVSEGNFSFPGPKTKAKAISKIKDAYSRTGIHQDGMTHADSNLMAARRLRDRFRKKYATK